MGWSWLQRLIIVFSFLCFRSWSSNNYPFLHWRAILCVWFGYYDFFEKSFLLSSQKIKIVENTIVFFLIIIFILWINRRYIYLFGVVLSLNFIWFDNSVNHSFQTAHNSTLFLNFDKNFSEDGVHAIFGHLYDVFLKEGRKIDFRVVDADLSFDLRINIANLRYMC
jgi:hypothetical protein